MRPENTPVGLEGAAHLLRRTGFGSARTVDVTRVAKLTRSGAVDHLLTGINTAAITTLPTLSPAPTRAMNRNREALTTADRAARKAARTTLQHEGRGLKAWWFNEMVSTSSPVTERLVLMWHGHFTSSLRKVRVPLLLARQNEMLRRHAAGSFRALLHDVVVDPAMLLYLDGQQNRATAPNENFARELFELFTLGVGHYSELDVKEAARAFAGTGIRRDDGSVVARRRQQDRGEKTILGQTERFDGDDVVDLLLQQPATAQTIARLYWQTFVEPDADEAVIAGIGARFATHFDLRRLLREVLLDDRFWATAARFALIKSPVDVVVGTARMGTVSVDGGVDPDAVAGTPAWSVRMLRQLGQDLFDPPDVRGWPGHTHWVTTATLPRRLIVARTLAEIGGADVDIDDPRFQLL